MSGVAQLLAGLVLATGLTGCTLLDLFLGEPPFDPTATFPIALPTPAAVLTTGTATIKLAGETLVLDTLVGERASDPEFGTSVTWTNGAGWYMSYIDYGDGGFDSSFLSIDRIVGVQHWVTYDTARCIVTPDKSAGAGAQAIKGTALCRGLEWSDYFSQSFGTGEPVEIEGQAPFDADITFEAR